MSLAAWFRVLTAESRGAIAVIRVWGPDAVAVVDSVFRPQQGPPLSRTATEAPRPSPRSFAPWWMRGPSWETPSRPGSRIASVPRRWRTSPWPPL
jgi:hypothetical protein